MTRGRTVIVDAKALPSGEKMIELECGCVFRGCPPIIREMKLCSQHGNYFLERLDEYIAEAVRQIVDVEFKARIRRKLRRLVRLWRQIEKRQRAAASFM